MPINKWYNFLMIIVFGVEKKSYSIFNFGQKKVRVQERNLAGCWLQRLARPRSCSPSPGMQPFCKIAITTKFIFRWLWIESQDKQGSSHAQEQWQVHFHVTAVNFLPGWRLWYKHFRMKPSLHWSLIFSRDIKSAKNGNLKSEEKDQ